MNLIIFSNKSVGVNEFVNFWSQLYNDPNENKYKSNINKIILDENALLALFEWKNGSKLSNLKLKSFNSKILSKIQIINALKNSTNIDLEKFLEEFKEVSLIWKIFLLHLIKSDEYPIFDQHVYRAFYFIMNSKVKELANNDNEKEKIYFESYLPFFKQIQGEYPLKKVDESLWAFGKFLKSDYKKIVSLNLVLR